MMMFSLTVRVASNFFLVRKLSPNGIELTELKQSYENKYYPWENKII